MDTLERIRFATRHFHALQGLRVLPLGLAVLLLPWLSPPPYPFMGRTGRDLAIPMLIVLAMFAANIGVGRYYRERFGSLKPHSGGVTGWIATTGMIVTYGAADWLQLRIAPPISLRALALAGFFLVVYLLSSRVRTHYRVAAAVLAGLALLPLAGAVTASELFLEWDRVGATVLGIVLMACGVLDHRLLRRLFAPRRGTLEQPA
jgi:hypothetical protein